MLQVEELSRTTDVVCDCGVAEGDEEDCSQQGEASSSRHL